MTSIILPVQPLMRLATLKCKRRCTESFDQLGNRTNVLALPPDFTRYNSRAGQLTCMAYEYSGTNDGYYACVGDACSHASLATRQDVSGSTA